MIFLLYIIITRFLSYILSFYSSADHPDLHSFPTRRSSDLSADSRILAGFRAGQHRCRRRAGFDGKRPRRAQILSKSHRRCREARAKNPPPSGPWPCLTLLKGTARKPSNSSRKSSISPCGICSSKEKLPTKPLGFASTPATWIRPSIGTRLVTTRD